jgi:hypothetical protein
MATLYAIDGTTAQGTTTDNALCANYGYRSGDKHTFACRVIEKFLLDNVKKYRMDLAEPNRDQVREDAETEMDGLSAA